MISLRRIVLFAALVSSFGSPILAAPTAEQRQEVKALEATITKAGNLYKEEKFKDSAELVRDVQAKMDQLVTSGGKDVLPLLDGLYGRLAKAHALLEIEGITLPELKKPEVPKAGSPTTAGASFV